MVRCWADSMHAAAHACTACPAMRCSQRARACLTPCILRWTLPYPARVQGRVTSNCNTVLAFFWWVCSRFQPPGPGISPRATPAPPPALPPARPAPPRPAAPPCACRPQGGLGAAGILPAEHCGGRRCRRRAHLPLLDVGAGRRRRGAGRVPVQPGVQRDQGAAAGARVHPASSPGLAPCPWVPAESWEEMAGLARLPPRIRPAVFAFGTLADGFLPFEQPGCALHDANGGGGGGGKVPSISEKAEVKLCSIVMKAVQSRRHGLACATESGAPAGRGGGAGVRGRRGIGSPHAPPSPPLCFCLTTAHPALQRASWGMMPTQPRCSLTAACRPTPWRARGSACCCWRASAPSTRAQLRTRWPGHTMLSRGSVCCADR